MLLFVIPYIIIIYSLRKEVDIMDYISVKAASEKWGISERRIQKLCEENRIDGTEKFGRAIVGQLSRQIFMPFIMNLVNVCSSHEHTIPFIA